MPVFATKKELAVYGLNRRQARKLELALCALADHEGAVKKALIDSGLSDHSHREICHALRIIVDGK